MAIVATTDYFRVSRAALLDTSSGQMCRIKSSQSGPEFLFLTCWCCRNLFSFRRPACSLFLLTDISAWARRFLPLFIAPFPIRMSLEVGLFYLQSQNWGHFQRTCNKTMLTWLLNFIINVMYDMKWKTKTKQKNKNKTKDKTS